MNNLSKNNKITILSNFSTIFMVAIFIAFFFIPFAYAKEINLKNTVYLVNQSRSLNGLNKLYINPTLLRIAEDKAHNMITYHYFAHTSPNGINPWYWFEKNNYNYKYAGENLAINYTTAEEQHKAWMNSPTHRKNILNPNYTEIGVSTASGYIDKKPAFITVQVFGKPQTIIAKNQIYNNSQKQTLLQSSVLGNTFNSFSPTYLQEKTTPSYQQKNNSDKIIYQKIVSTKNTSLLFTQKHIHNFLWLIILILGIIIVRDLVLSTINSSFARHHSTTNLILLLMLWSILIGI